MKTTCDACGNNPVPHRLEWLGQTFSIYSAPIYRKICTPRISWVLSRIVEGMLSGMLHLFLLLGIAKKNNNPERVANRRGQVLWEAAKQKGIDMQNILFLDKPTDLYEAKLPEGTLFWSGLPRPNKTIPETEWMLDDKFLLKNRLLAHNIPAPRGESCTTLAEAENCFDLLTKPVIIKPRMGSRGRHTTTHIYTKKDLKNGFYTAKKLCHAVIIEEHLFGSVYRATVVGGKLIGLLRGDPPRITGDGTSSIEQLVAQKNSIKHEIVHNIILNAEHDIFLSRIGYTRGTILQKGTTIDLTEKIGVTYGGHSKECLDFMHPSWKVLFETAAKIVGDPMVGFDVILTDETTEPSSQRWGIIECNGMPFINLHHDPVEGSPKDAAGAVWNYVQKNINKEYRVKKNKI